MAAQSEILNIKNQINDTMQRSAKVVDLWLEEQELSISESKKNKLALLLARYYSEEDNFSQETALNLLRNLGGGHFDSDDIESVEIEIQRLLGHTTPIGAVQTNKFIQFSILTALGILVVMSVSLISIAQSKNTSSAIPLSVVRTGGLSSPLISPQQDHELRELVKEINKLEAEFGLRPVTYERAIEILGEPLGISSADKIPEAQYLTLKRTFHNVLDYFQNQKRLRQQDHTAPQTPMSAPQSE